jgi:hypothetical protein
MSATPRADGRKLKHTVPVVTQLRAGFCCRRQEVSQGVCVAVPCAAAIRIRVSYYAFGLEAAYPFREVDSCQNYKINKDGLMRLLRSAGYTGGKTPNATC